MTAPGRHHIRRPITYPARRHAAIFAIKRPINQAGIARQAIG